MIVTGGIGDFSGFCAAVLSVRAVAQQSPRPADGGDGSGGGVVIRAKDLNNRVRQCEERSDEAIQCSVRKALDCFATLAMTKCVAVVRI